MKKGFTLAEVLITLGIIGVVAAMTIPTLVANYQKKVYVSQLQKTVATISNAAKLLMADEQTFNLNQTYLYSEDYTDESLENSIGKFFKKYLKVVKTCTYENYNNDCIADEYKGLDGQYGAFNTSGSSSYCAILNNGASICMSNFGEWPATIAIDINGKAGPNVMGRDAFDLRMNYNGTIAESFSNDLQYGINQHKPEACGDATLNISYGVGCYNKIVQDGWKMDY